MAKKPVRGNKITGLETPNATTVHVDSFHVTISGPDGAECAVPIEDAQSLIEALQTLVDQ